MYKLERVRILIVESSDHMAGIFRTCLAMMSIPNQNIEIVYDVETAFGKFQRIQHDIVITDWMPGGAGLKLVEKIRKHDESPSKYIPIVMTAGSGNLKRVLLARDAGVSEYMVKPFSAQDLARRLTRVIEKPKPFIVSENYVGHDRRVKTMSFDGEDRRITEPEVHYE